MNAAFAAMGMTVPTTTAQLSDLISGLDLTTERGRIYLSVLTQIAPVLTQIIDAEKQLADTRAAQNVTVLQLLGKTEEALAAQRFVELAAMDASLRPMQQYIYALQDQATAGQKAIDAMTKLVAQMDALEMFTNNLKTSIQSIRQDAAGYDLAGYLAGEVTSKKAALAALDTPGTTIEDRIKAAGELQAAIIAQYNNEKTLLNAKATAEQAAYNASIAAQNKAISAANQLSDAYRSIGDYAQTLLIGNLSGVDQSAEITRQYRETMALAGSGDLKAIGRVQSVTDAYLQNMQATSRTSTEYGRAFARVQTDLANLSSEAMPTLEQVTGDGFKISAGLQEEMNASQLKAIDELKKIQTLSDKWNKELQDKLAAQALIFDNLRFTNEQIMLNTVNLDTRIAAAILAALPLTTGQPLVPPPQIYPNAPPPPHGTGGEGSVPWMAGPGRNNSSAANDALIGEVKALRTEVMKLAKSAAQTAASTKQTAETFDNTTGGGGPMLVQIVA